VTRILYISIILAFTSFFLNLYFGLNNLQQNHDDFVYRNTENMEIEYWEEISTMNFQCDQISLKHIYSISNFIEADNEIRLLKFSILNGKAAASFEKVQL